jgi:hypothetical protein
MTHRQPWQPTGSLQPTGTGWAGPIREQATGTASRYPGLGRLAWPTANAAASSRSSMAITTVTVLVLLSVLTLTSGSSLQPGIGANYNERFDSEPVSCESEEQPESCSSSCLPICFALLCFAFIAFPSETHT